MRRPLGSVALVAILLLAGCEAEAPPTKPSVDDVVLRASEVVGLEHVPADRLALEGLQEPAELFADIAPHDGELAGSVFVSRGREGILAVMRSVAARYADDQDASGALQRLRSRFVRRELGARPNEIEQVDVGDEGFSLSTDDRSSGAVAIAWREDETVLILTVLGEPRLVRTLEMEGLVDVMASRAA